MVPVEMKNLNSLEDLKKKIEDGNLTDVIANSAKALGNVNSVGLSRCSLKLTQC